MRSVDLDVASSTVSILGGQVVSRTRRFESADAVILRMALQTKLGHTAGAQ